MCPKNPISSVVIGPSTRLSKGNRLAPRLGINCHFRDVDTLGYNFQDLTSIIGCLLFFEPAARTVCECFDQKQHLHGGNSHHITLEPHDATCNFGALRTTMALWKGTCRGAEAWYG
mmetsp:Transcript_19376/g.27281  ORF Transcript_19376/g.27281 Transcript_19376/m.27281 type:complete len:116 (+) Transcript_19376:569-916(+)